MWHWMSSWSIVSQNNSFKTTAKDRVWKTRNDVIIRRAQHKNENDDVEIYHSTTNSKLWNGYTGVPQIPFTAPSSQRHSSTSGITHMSPDREELTLFRDLFDGYDKRLRPALRKEDNVTVILGISVHQLIDIVSTWCMRYIVSLFDQAFVIK